MSTFLNWNRCFSIKNGLQQVDPQKKETQNLNLDVKFEIINIVCRLEEEAERADRVAALAEEEARRLNFLNYSLFICPSSSMPTLVRSSVR